MQPLLIKVNVPQKASFSVNRYKYEGPFPGIWHFHDEYELTLILQGRGTRMVGDNIDRFEEGDIIFIGKNLPHTWRSEQLSSPACTESLVLHFLEDFLGPYFFDVPEMTKVRRLLERSRRGLRIYGKTKGIIIRALLETEQSEGAEKLIRLLSILQVLADSPDLAVLSSEGFTNSINQADSERLNKVYEYIMNNFRENISLTQIATIANMSPTAFSRYFKNRTRKSFSEFLIELKIGYACKLLMKEDLTVSQVCYESGFQNLSNFNQQFKKSTRLTPKKYQLLHVGSE